MTRERDLFARMELADMLPLVGGGYRSVLAANVHVPSVVLAGESRRDAILRWRGASRDDDYVTGAPAFEPRPAAGMLASFLRIEDETDVLNFAKHFGVLAFCEECGEPTSLGGPGWYARSAGSPADGSDHECSVPQHDGFFEEPLYDWLAVAAQIRSVALVAAHLHAGTPITSRDMQRAIGMNWIGLGRHASRVFRKPEDYWGLIGITLRGLVRRAGVRLMVRPRMESIGLALEIPSTFAHLVLQLVLAVARAGDLEVCSICQLPYLRIGRRRATPSRRNVCDSDNCTKDAARIRQQESRKQRESQLAPSSGKVPGEGPDRR